MSHHSSRAYVIQFSHCLARFPWPWVRTRTPRTSVYFRKMLHCHLFLSKSTVTGSCSMVKAAWTELEQLIHFLLGWPERGGNDVKWCDTWKVHQWKLWDFVMWAASGWLIKVLIMGFCNPYLGRITLPVYGIEQPTGILNTVHVLYVLDILQVDVAFFSFNILSFFNWQLN